MSALDYRAIVAEERRKLLLLRERSASGDEQSTPTWLSISAPANGAGILPQSTDPPRNELRVNDINQQHFKFSTVKLRPWNKAQHAGSLAPFRLDSKFQDIFYIPDVVDKSDEQALLLCVHADPREISFGRSFRRKSFDEEEVDVGWKVLQTRRLQSWGQMPPPNKRSGDHSSVVDTKKLVELLDGVNTLVTENTSSTAVESEAHANNSTGSRSVSGEGASTRDDMHIPSRVEDSDSEAMPSWLLHLIDQLMMSPGIFPPTIRPNNVLINQYTPAQGIMHHTDGPMYHPFVAILSLGEDESASVAAARRFGRSSSSSSEKKDGVDVRNDEESTRDGATCVMTFRRNLRPEEVGQEGVFAGDLFSVVLEPRSLLLFSRDVYTECMHGIAAETPIIQVRGPMEVDDDDDHIGSAGGPQSGGLLSDCPCLNLHLLSREVNDPNGVPIAMEQQGESEVQKVSIPEARVPAGVTVHRSTTRTSLTFRRVID